jgi:hypothetical protein
MIPASNKYMLLNNLNDSTRPKLSDTTVKNRKSAVVKVKKHRVVLICDHHMKRCLEKVSKLLEDLHNVTEITKPNVILEAITSHIDMNVDSYTKDDVWYGLVYLFTYSITYVTLDT